jgi:predicted phosphodiesterase
MIDRVERGDDPKIRIQSPTLDVFFLHGDEIFSEVKVHDGRLVVVQTSSNPDLVEALHTHAAEVTAMANRGMDAVHEMMVKQGRGH